MEDLYWELGWIDHLLGAMSLEYNLWELSGVVAHHYPLDQIPPNKWLSYFLFGTVVGKKKILFFVSSPHITINLEI